MLSSQEGNRILINSQGCCEQKLGSEDTAPPLFLVAFGRRMSSRSIYLPLSFREWIWGCFNQLKEMSFFLFNLHGWRSMVIQPHNINREDGFPFSKS
jgi:hypothetical protein